ncbi:MAG: hypothetical protein KDB61_01225, partial [Planctomycetes bacterium]|nr:hypothetical protein [Planctomycetota bacterium]
MLTPSISRMAPALCLWAAIGGAAPLFAQGDDCASATPIAGTGTFGFDNTSNTTSGFTGVNCTPAIQQDVFWRWTAPQAGDYQFDTFGTSFDTNMSVHSGGDCSATCVASNDDAGSSLQSSVQVSGVQAGDELLVQVGSFLLFAGAGQMNVSQVNNPCAGLLEDTLEPNNSCAQRVALTPGLHTDLFVSQVDPDYFSVVVQPGEHLVASVAGQTAGDVDLTLYDSGCSYLMSDGVQVHFTHVGTGARTLVIEAFLDTSTNSTPCAQYDLNVRIVSDPCIGQSDDPLEDHDSCNTAMPVGDGTWTGLHVDLWDKDFYEFCVPANGTVRFDALFPHAQGDVDMFLWADWSYPCGIGTAGPTLVQATSVDDDETIQWTNPSPF